MVSYLQLVLVCACVTLTGGFITQDFTHRRITAARLAHDQGEVLLEVLEQQQGSVDIDVDLQQYIHNINTAQHQLQDLQGELQDDDEASGTDISAAVDSDLSNVDLLLALVKDIDEDESLTGEEFDALAEATRSLDYDFPCWYTPEARDANHCDEEIVSFSTALPPTSVQLTIINNYPVAMSVRRILSDGSEQEYRILVPGESYLQQSFTGHSWIFKVLYECGADALFKRVPLPHGECHYEATSELEQTVELK